MSEQKNQFNFNLLKERWIPCQMVSARSAKLEYFGIEETLRRADEIREIAGESPPITITLYRLLLAIIHRSLGPLSYHGQWQKYWEDKELFQTGVAAYLSRKEPIDIAKRFDLFESETPFYQATNTVAHQADGDSIIGLLFQADNNALLFDHHAVADSSPFSPAQAARWLVAFQSFDVSGLIKPDKLDPEITDKPERKLRSANASPLLQKAVGLVRGRTLFETLMLNLFWDDDSFFNSFGDLMDLSRDVPAWERADLTKAKAREPLGYLDLLTWQSRRIRLIPSLNEAGITVVKQAVVMDGYRFKDSFNFTGKETMVAYAAVTNPNSAKGEAALGFRGGKSLWRDSFTIFHQLSTHQNKPWMLGWIENLRDQGVLSLDDELPMDFFGMTYDRSNVARLLFWRHERLPLPLRYLGNEVLCLELNRALVFSEKAAKLLAAAVRRFLVLTLLHANDRANPKYFQPLLKKDERQKTEEEQKKYEQKNGYKAAPKKPHPIYAKVEASGAELRYWPRLENEFRRLLAALAFIPNSPQIQPLLTAILPQGETHSTGKASKWLEQRSLWAGAVEKAVRQSFMEIVGGRGKTARTLRATAIAESWFNPEFSKLKNTYLKGKVVKFETEDNQSEDTDERRAE